jgi:zinc transporter ZupT
MISYTWWQTSLQILNNALLIGGALGCFSALYYAIRGRPYRPNRHPLWVAVWSLAAFAAGVLLYFSTRNLIPSVALLPTENF